MSAILPSDASIPGHGFYLIAENGFTNADYVVELEFHNGPDSVELRDETGTKVDGLMYGGFTVGGEGDPSIGVGPGYTLERYSDSLRKKQDSSGGNGYDTDNNSRDFVSI
ncbi:hypothetical protein AKJ54_01255 [candidate division MSBL1 archaeon SCGC-AAA382K21]|uniref:Uncharacterized protein n=1 Tax=candidate division MSBL1 archaeon SCGC-AAA382K21 TaxID=1698283 RepID=A0A133VJI1_9EURY|nr:hypothetical protein AKJ54_01255 [candidate division MSBL1 archaeon SCGC-AAA382K21]